MRSHGEPTPLGSVGETKTSWMETSDTGSGMSLPGTIPNAEPSPAISLPSGRPMDAHHDSRPAEPTPQRKNNMARRIQLWMRRFTQGSVRWQRTVHQATRARKNNLKSQIQEICIYVVFLAVFTVSSILVVQDQKLFLFAKQIRGQIAEQEFEPSAAHIYKDMADVETIGEFYDWLAGPVYGTLYTDGTMEGFDDQTHPGTLFGVNYIVGGIAISQVRVSERPCGENSHGFKFNKTSSQMKCYGDPDNKGEFSLDTESKEPFGNFGHQYTWDGNHGTSYWSVEHERDNGYWRRTNWQSTYPAGAYRVILPNRDGEKAAEMIEMLQNSSYVDIQTRAVFFEFTVYNPNLDYFCHVFCTIEQKPSGGLLATFQTDVLRLYTLVESASLVTVVLEVLVSIFYLYYMIREVLRIIKQGGVKYFTSVENIVQNLNVFMYILTWVFRLLMHLNLPEDVVVDSDTFYPFHNAAAYKAIAIYCNSFNAFLCWFKLVKYLGLLPNYALITGTIARAASGVSGFMVVFMLVFYGFCAAFMMTFGSKVSGYRNMTQSASSLLRSLLGDFDYDELQSAQWFMGPFLFVLFVCVAVFVVLNALISIIGESYEEQRAELQNSKDVQLGKEMGNYIHDTIMNIPLVGRFFKATKARAKQAVSSLQDGVARAPVWNRLSSNGSRPTSRVRRSTVGSKHSSDSPRPGRTPKSKHHTVPITMDAARPTATTTGGRSAGATGKGSGAGHPASSSVHVAAGVRPRRSWATSADKLKEFEVEGMRDLDDGSGAGGPPPATL